MSPTLKRKIVLASSNNGKLLEIQDIYRNYDIEFINQDDLLVETAEETGKTFVENALLKARNASIQTGLPAIADDSGLIVDVLNGSPGIFSARYAGVLATDKENNEKLLKDLEGKNNRKASFCCAALFLRNPEDTKPIIVEKYWCGEITKKIMGNSGFGYDPIFYVQNLSCTSSELSTSEKSLYSHRGRAMRLLGKMVLEEFNLL